MTERQKVALISVFNKEGIDDFAARLVKLGWKIVSSGGTAKFLMAAGLPVLEVGDYLMDNFLRLAQQGHITYSELPADLVNLKKRMVENDLEFGAMLGHRVVTLSREIHAGLLAKHTPEHEAEMAKFGLLYIDLCCCDFYPLSAEIAKENSTLESVIEQTDIGGPTMVRSGAKGGRIVVVDVPDRQIVIEQLEANGEVMPETIQYLRAKAEFIVAGYCLDSAKFHGDGDYAGLTGRRIATLAYGENRYQKTPVLCQTDFNDPLGWGVWRWINGEPGFINLADGDRTLDLMCLLCEAFKQNIGSIPFLTIACKHGNPCGIGTSWSDPVESILKAMTGDSAAVMGAEVMCNFRVGEPEARAVYEVPSEMQAQAGRKFWGADVVFAAGFNEPAVALLAKKGSRRLLANEALLEPFMAKNPEVIRMVRGGFIVQGAPNFVLNLEDEGTIQEFLNPNYDTSFVIDLIIAWAVTYRANSNTVALAKNGMLLALGCGQQDRMACAELCLRRAQRSSHVVLRSVFGSDAFFPFAKRTGEDKPLEALEMLIEAGCIGGVVPADGKYLPEVMALASEQRLSVVFLKKEYRGFSQH